jgi:hypothetical protein
LAKERRNAVKKQTLEFLNANKSETPSKWQEEAERRHNNVSVIRDSRQNSNWTDSFAGKWQDDRDADEMVEDIRKSRYLFNRDVNL